MFNNIKPKRFRSFEEWERYRDGQLKDSDLVQPFIRIGDTFQKNPEYETLPFELRWIMEGLGQREA